MGEMLREICRETGTDKVGRDRSIELRKLRERETGRCWAGLGNVEWRDAYHVMHLERLPENGRGFLHFRSLSLTKFCFAAPDIISYK